MTNFGYLVDLSAITALDENNGVFSNWVHVLPMGTYKHPLYGTISVNEARAKAFADSVNNKTRGIEPSVNYNHNNEDIAAGWGKKAEARTDGLWMFVEWTAAGAEKIKAKEYKYFSAEFVDEWEDNQGNKFKDVVFGGALTNRPFMKNLTPINLSEEVYTLAFDLVAAATGKTTDDLKGGNGVGLSDDDLKKIVEGVTTKLNEGKPAGPATPNQKLSDIPELKALAEENPIVKQLLSAVETQNLSIAENEQKLKEAEILRKLAEFDRSKIVLSATAKQRVIKLAMEMNTELVPEFWSLLEDMKRSSSFLVELGERAGITVNYGSVKPARVQLQEAANKIKAGRTDLTDSDAFNMAVAENPALYQRYRTEMSEGVAN